MLFSEVIKEGMIYLINLLRPNPKLSSFEEFHQLLSIY